MQTQEELKELVKQKYAEIASQDRETNAGSCCGATVNCCGTSPYTVLAEDYSQLGGYHPDADLGLGCGLPTKFAGIRPGDVVVDLGSGAGNDAFVARSEAGASGRIIGIDFTSAMVEKAVQNAKTRGFTNVEFRLGDIEDMPLRDNSADVVISNCVLNLIPNKQNVFREIFRILKSGGHFSISDIVLLGELPPALRDAAEMYAGCVAGAVQKNDYLEMITEAGFSEVGIQNEKSITLPDNVLASYLSHQEIEDFKSSGAGIYGITVYAEKHESRCCQPGAGCC